MNYRLLINESLDLSKVSESDRLAFHLRHQQEIESYFNQREQLAESVRQRLSHIQLSL